MKYRTSIIVALVGSLSLTAGFSLAGQTDRREAMKAIGAAAKALSKGEDPVVHATVIAEKAGMIPALFETNEITGDSKALPVIWEQYDDFTAKGAGLEQAALAVLAAANGGGDVAAAAKEMGATCGACHKVYKTR